MWNTLLSRTKRQLSPSSTKPTYSCSNAFFILYHITMIKSMGKFEINVTFIFRLQLFYSNLSKKAFALSVLGQLKKFSGLSSSRIIPLSTNIIRLATSLAKFIS